MREKLKNYKAALAGIDAGNVQVDIPEHARSERHGLIHEVLSNARVPDLGLLGHVGRHAACITKVVDAVQNLINVAFGVDEAAHAAGNGDEGYEEGEANDIDASPALEILGALAGERGSLRGVLLCGL